MFSCFFGNSQEREGMVQTLSVLQQDERIRGLKDIF